MTKTHLIRLVLMAMLAAISIVLVALIQFPLLPSATFLKYDMADVPVLIGTMLFGIGPGITILFLVSLIQAFFLGGDGWIGFVMHFLASGAMVIIIGAFYRRFHKWPQTLIGMGLASVARALVMIPMNLILTPLFMGATLTQVVAMIIPVLLPFNLLVAVLNCTLTALLFKALTPFLKKSGLLAQPNPLSYKNES